MSDPEHSARIVRELHDLGVQISIDDFGTGYSSLAYLQRLAVDELKIDKSFTMRLGEASNATIVRSTIDLGHNLGLRVVAEGVETKQSAEQLARMGCDLLQGYLIGRPAPATDIPALAAKSHSSLVQRLVDSSAGPVVEAQILELVPRTTRTVLPTGSTSLRKA